MDGYAVRSMCDRRCPSGIRCTVQQQRGCQDVRMHSIVPKDRQAAIVLAAAKGEALARQPDGRP